MEALKRIIEVYGHTPQAKALIGCLENKTNPKFVVNGLLGSSISFFLAGLNKKINTPRYLLQTIKSRQPIFKYH